MIEKETGRSVEFIDENGQPEFWWNGQNYGCVLPEELIDAVLIASNQVNQNGGNNNGNKEKR